MKKALIAMAMFVAITVIGVHNSYAQPAQRTNVGQLVSGLINVNVGAVAVNISDITLDDLVDVGDVLSDNRDIRILTNILNHNPIASNNADVLTNLLRGADILTDTQVVVGVLGGAFAIQDLLPVP
jgi:hypothetical protein